MAKLIGSPFNLLPRLALSLTRSLSTIDTTPVNLADHPPSPSPSPLPCIENSPLNVANHPSSTCIHRPQKLADHTSSSSIDFQKRPSTPPSSSSYMATTPQKATTSSPSPIDKYPSSTSSSIGINEYSPSSCIDFDVYPSTPSSNIGPLDLKNGEALFSGMSSKELLRSLINLSLVAYEPFVDAGIRLMKSPSLLENPIFRQLGLPIIKKTLYDHFCAGEDMEEARGTLERLWGVGLRGVLDYGLEDAEDDLGCDENLDQFLKTVEMASFLPPSSVSFACVKITAICPLSLLERVSDLLRWEHKDPTLRLPWKRDTLPILSPSSPVYHTPNKPESLSQTEEARLNLAHERLEKLCKKCNEFSSPLLIDAEYTTVQPAIDYLSNYASIMFNKDENALVYGTIQAYLKDAKERLVMVLGEAEKRGISVGFKLVRGAYISREVALARSLGAPSPINPSIQATHGVYDSCASLMLENIVKGRASVVLATHNLESGKAAVAKAEELGLSRENPRLQFAQLKGMADTLSFGLKQAGFQVCKYLPYGPLDKVIPYLLRRAEENRGMLSSSATDRLLMGMELKRRLKAAVFGG
ncbi:proline dehydrogenase 2, mitochondrial isoform X2 [Amborella trichopoda]|uniref:proline dehydrogenase 2, mitochondrial isoform X2 n=1 Tax=Amborella trichopoda TaxID=13333 RepID=UPI0005D3BB93|nr:proline dehydrogenase 2, mitochondrial isoform X2 [Amborella trichopoda]|eukprot:XP_006844178.2 proline dehydrogenase 2, mitochondrial isoform X2 [Amborella trichopoda]